MLFWQHFKASCDHPDCFSAEKERRASEKSQRELKRKLVAKIKGMDNTLKQVKGDVDGNLAKAIATTTLHN